MAVKVSVAWKKKQICERRAIRAVGVICFLASILTSLIVAPRLFGDEPESNGGNAERRPPEADNLDLILTEIRAQVDEFCGNEDVEGAIAYLREYDGPHAFESAEARILLESHLRDLLARERISRENKQAAAHHLLDRLYEQVANDLLRQDFEGALLHALQAELKAAQESEDNKDLSELVEIVRGVAEMPRIVMRALGKARGKDVVLFLKNGRKKLRIDGLDENGLRVEQRVVKNGVAANRRRFRLRYDDLNTRECFRRLPTGKGSTVEIMRGLLTHAGGRKDLAEKHFQAAKCRLGSTLLNCISETQTTDSRESEDPHWKGLVSDYRQILHAGGIDENAADSIEATRQIILKKAFDKKTIGKMRHELDRFREKHGKEAFTKSHESVLSLIDHLRDGKPLYYDPVNIQKALAQLADDNPWVEIKSSVDFESDGIALNMVATSRLRDISALSGLPLKSLYLFESEISGLEAIRGMSLKELTLRCCRQLKSLRELSGMKLEKLNIEGCVAITDLEPLKDMMTLKSLDISGCLAIGDISPLKRLPLTSLDMGCCPQLGDEALVCLDRMPLKSLNLSSSPWLTDLHPIRNLPLRELNISHCQGVKNLRDLKHMQLHTLNISNCMGIRNLRPIRNLPLKHLEVVGIHSKCDLSHWSRDVLVMR